MVSEKQATFGLVHGAWHGAWCWEYLQDELNKLGRQSIAMDLPVDNPGANFDNYSDSVVKALKNESEVILVGHSRGGNVIPRAAGMLAVQKLIFLCSSFELATVGRPYAKEIGCMPPRNISAFNEGFTPLGNDLYEYNKELAKEIFFQDCSPEVQEWATNRLRPQRRSTDEPILEKWPNDLPQEYIYCEDDLVVNPEWSRYAATQWLNVEPIPFPGGHSPMLSNPTKLAKLLVRLSE